jgi:hypothetical protein
VSPVVLSGAPMWCESVWRCLTRWEDGKMDCRWEDGGDRVNPYAERLSTTRGEYARSRSMHR